jgi:WD40 repeat protein
MTEAPATLAAAARSIEREPASAPRQPFVGLRPFTCEDHEFFFGRDEQITALEEGLRRDRLLSVIGSSGSGKSSLVRAGLLPRMERDGLLDRRWRCAELRPGGAPIRRLAQALVRALASDGAAASESLVEAREDRAERTLRESSFGISRMLELAPLPEGTGLLILIDQFEELFRFADLRAQQTLDAQEAHDQRDDATLFVRLLLTAREDPGFSGLLVITMRSDFIGDCARFHGLSEAVTTTQYLTPALTRDQRTQSIRRPLDKVGAEIDAAVVQRVLNDTNEDPDQLPVMQHALMRCWQRAVDRGPIDGKYRLTAEDYKEIGTARTALSKHAEEILSQLDETVVQRVFQSLTDIDSQGRVTRRPQRLRNLVAVLVPDNAAPEGPEIAAARSEVLRVVERFSDRSCSFLRVSQAAVLSDEGVVDIGHEALIRRWNKLGALDESGAQVNWVRAEQADGEMLRKLAGIADAEAAVSTQKLKEYEDWRRERRPNRFWARRYAREGSDPLQPVLDLLQRSHKELFWKRVRWWGAVSACIIVPIAVAIGFIWEQVSAYTRLHEANERLISVIGWDALGDSAHKALLIAHRGLEAETPLRQNVALTYRALERMHEIAILRSPSTQTQSPVQSVAFLKGGDLLKLENGTLDAWDVSGVEPKFNRVVADKVGSEIFDLAISADGKKLLLASFSQSVSLMDLEHGPDLRRLGGAEDRPGAGAFNRDGEYIVTASRIAPPKLWRHYGTDPLDYRIVDRPGRDFADLRGGGMAAAFNPSDPTMFAVGSEEGAVHLFRIDPNKAEDGVTRIGAELPFPKGKPGVRFMSALAFDPNDSNRLLVVYFSGAVLWNLETRSYQDLPRSLASFRAAFSPDGRFIATGTGDGSVRLYRTDRADEPPLELATGGGGGTWSVAFNPHAPDQLAAATMRAGVWLMQVDSALSRGISQPEPRTSNPVTAATAADDTPKDVLASGPGVVLKQSTDGFRIVSSRSDVPSMKLDLPEKDEPAPLAAAFSDDGYWLAWARAGKPRKPSANQADTAANADEANADKGNADIGIALFDLRRWTSPAAILAPRLKLREVHFAATSKDRLVMATTKDGDQRAWRYFQTPQDLDAYAQNQLPLDRGEKAHLSPRDECELKGLVWELASRSEQDEARVDCNPPIHEMVQATPPVNPSK